jgi:hypothetical protein
VLARFLLGIDEFAVQLDLEDAAPRGDQQDLVQGVFELFEYALRQTDGSRCIPSLGAVFDGYLHLEQTIGPCCLNPVSAASYLVESKAIGGH